jgi:hypothetical protein
MKNRTRAISALAVDMPVKPKIAVTIEIRKNMRAHFSNVTNGPFNSIDRAFILTQTLGLVPNRQAHSYG